MKKFMAVIIAAALIIALFAVPSSAAEIVDIDDVNVVAAWFDDILWTANTTEVRQSAAGAGVTDLHVWYSGFGADGLGKSYTSPLNAFDTIILSGWIGFDQEIECFGYQIDDNAPVLDIYSGAYEPTTEKEVKDAGGQYAKRYFVSVPLALAGVGSHTFRVVAKLADGRIVKLNSTADGVHKNTEFKINNIFDFQFKEVKQVINYDESWQVGMSLDRIFWNFNLVGNRSAEGIEQYAEEDGSLDAVKYGGMCIGYTGWVDFVDPLIGFGYMINDTIVLQQGFTDCNEDTLEPAIRSWGGNWETMGQPQRFCIFVPISDLTGDNYVCAVAQLEDGTVVKLNSTEIHNRDTSFVLHCAEEEAHEPIMRDFDSALDKQYFDQVLVNGTEIANGNDALIELKKNALDGSDGTYNTISTYGWYASLQDGITLDQFGYMIDDNDPVFSADFTTDTAQDVLDLGGTRYLVNIDVSGLNDGQEHVLTTVCRLSNGDIVKFNRPNREAVLRYIAPAAAETQQPTEPETNTQTGDLTVAMFAVIAVLAMGAAVVFMKKKAF